MILSDIDIKNYIQLGKLKINSPRKELSIQQNGLDCRIGDNIAVDIDLNYIVDSHNIQSTNCRFKKYKNDFFIIPPHTNILLVTEEVFEFPDDLMAFCGLRSSVARMGFIAPITIVDAGFKGTLTIELHNGSHNPIKIYTGDRFLHVIFAKTNSPVKFPYNGFYTGQKEVNLPKTLGD